jgi:streptogramin lyase
VIVDDEGIVWYSDFSDQFLGRLDTKTLAIKEYPVPLQREGFPTGALDLEVDPDGNMWLALREGNAVYKLDMKMGTVHHMAGTGKKGFTGNGGPARDATLSGPKGLSVAPNGNVYLADTESHSIRMIDVAKATIELIAGTGEKGDGPEGEPLKCKMLRPHGIFVDTDGTVFVGDTETHRVRMIQPAR